jgi:hypothetical protein
MKFSLSVATLAFIVAGPIGLSAASSGADEFRFEPTALPAPLLEDGKPNAVIEASGVEPIGDGRRFLVAHDKAPALHIVDLATGRLVGAPINSPKFPPATKTGPKWEGMARDSEGNYYVIGAHNGKTDEERATKSYLLRFRLKDGDADSPAVDDATVVRWEVARALVSALKADGLDEGRVAARKVEGLAVRDREDGGRTRRELVIGLREPSDRVRAYSADVTDASPGSELELKPAFAFEADPREGVESQLTTLEYVPALGGFLVVTAAEDTSNAFHGNTLYFVDGGTGRATRVATFEVAMKAEGLAVLGVDLAGGRTAVKLLITYDNDPHATKIPSRYQTATLVREPRWVLPAESRERHLEGAGVGGDGGVGRLLGLGVVGAGDALGLAEMAFP